MGGGVARGAWTRNRFPSAAAAASTVFFSRSFSINGVYRLNGIVGVPLDRSRSRTADQTPLLPSFHSLLLRPVNVILFFLVRRSLHQSRAFFIIIFNDVFITLAKCFVNRDPLRRVTRSAASRIAQNVDISPLFALDNRCLGEFPSASLTLSHAEPRSLSMA